MTGSEQSQHIYVFLDEAGSFDFSLQGSEYFARRLESALILAAGGKRKGIRLL